MKCPECQNEISSGELYCGVCGTEVRLTFDDLEEGLREEIKTTKEEDTEKQMRNMLLWMSFFMLVFWTTSCETHRGVVGLDPSVGDSAYYIPVYSTRGDVTQGRIYEDDSVDTIIRVDEQIEKNRRARGLGPR